MEGDIGRGDVVSCVDDRGREVARGLVNYDAQETARIQGQPSTRFQDILGYIDNQELIHRDNLVLIRSAAPGAIRPSSHRGAPYRRGSAPPGLIPL